MLNSRTLVVAAALSVGSLLAACSTSGDVESSSTTTTASEATSTVPETTTTASETTTTESKTTTSSSSGDEAVIDELAQAFIDDPDVPLEDPKVAECAATRFVELVGPDIGDVDFDEYVMDEDTAMEFASSFRECGFDISGFFADSMIEGGATEKQASCVVDEFGVENIERLFALGMMDGDMDELEDKMDVAIEACI